MTIVNSNKSTLFEKMNSGFKEEARTFKHSPLTAFELKRNDSPEGRTYTVLDTDEVFPSVTTVLSRIPNAGLDVWRKRVGAAEAKRIASVSAARGSRIHEMVESYLGGSSQPTRGHMPINVNMFRSLRPHLDNIDEIYGIEFPLYSRQLRAAGTCDLFAKYSGKKSIIDIKTSKSEKEESYILNYFFQTTAYYVMIKELYGIDVEQIVILIAIESGETQVFIKDPREYQEQVFDLFQKG